MVDELVGRLGVGVLLGVDPGERLLVNRCSVVIVKIGHLRRPVPCTRRRGGVVYGDGPRVRAPRSTTRKRLASGKPRPHGPSLPHEPARTAGQLEGARPQGGPTDTHRGLGQVALGDLVAAIVLLVPGDLLGPKTDGPLLEGIVDHGLVDPVNHVAHLQVEPEVDGQLVVVGLRRLARTDGGLSPHVVVEDRDRRVLSDRVGEASRHDLFGPPPPDVVLELIGRDHRLARTGAVLGIWRGPASEGGA